MKRALMLLACAICLVSAACYQGHGLDPLTAAEETSGISGTITFSGEWPDSTKEVRVAAFTTYPTGIKDKDSLLVYTLNALATGQLFFGDTIPRNSAHYDYLLDLPRGRYEWVLVVWFPDTDNYIMGVKEIGFYRQTATNTMQTVRVMPATISPGIDMTADFKHVHNNSPFIGRDEK